MALRGSGQGGGARSRNRASRRRCSRPATAPPACRISARSARWRAPPGCAAPSPRSPASPRACSPSATTWTGCARCRTTCRTRRCSRAHLGKPLTAIPDPFGTHESFGAHNNARLRAFLDSFGFEYEFASATEYYRAGRFDAALRRVLERYDEVDGGVLPTLGPERRATYSPFLPIHPETGRVMQVPIEARDVDAGTVTWRDPESGAVFTTPVTGGACKLQWKADWAMRWYALGVDYEMSGKDLIDSVRLSGRICAHPRRASRRSASPTSCSSTSTRQKISKSKGNGLSVEEWLRYAPPESLGAVHVQRAATGEAAVFRRHPPRGRRIPRQCRARARRRARTEQRANPAWHVHLGRDAQPRRQPGRATPCCSTSRAW